MPFFRWVSSTLLLISCVSWACASAWALPAPAPRWEVSIYSGEATAAGPTAAQIAAKPDTSFTSFNPDAIYATGLQKHVWLRVRVSSEQEICADAWLVGISKAFVDTVVLHTRAKNGVWSQQAAGDWLAHRSWPVRSLAPQFFVPVQNSGTQDFYLEVRNRTPLRFDVTFLSAPAAAVEAQNNFFLIGVAIGLMLLMVIASCVLTVAYRRLVYAWYGIYVITHMCVSLAYSGMGAYALWPDAKHWPELSITVLFMFGNVLQLQFCRAMFLTTTTPAWVQRAVLGVIALGFLAIALNAYVIAQFGSSAVFTLHVLVFTLLSLIVMVYQFNAKNLASWLFLVSSLPLAIMGLLAVLEHGGWVVLTWLPYNAPIYAFAIEIPVLFAAIYLHAKLEHAAKVRQVTLAGTDPTTGFISSSQHTETLAHAWDQAIDTQQDLVVAYVQVLHQPDPMATLGPVGRVGRVHGTEHAVRQLRTVAREHDLVVHVDTDLFAMLMPGLSLGEDLTNRLARLVALAVMADQDAARHAPIRFRIVAGSAGSFQGSADKLHASLKHKLNQTDWGQRAIRYVRSLSARGSIPDSSRPEETLSQFWDRAAAQENYPTTRQDNPVS